MNDMSEVAPAKTPTHLWVVGIMSLLWNLMGACVYTLTQLRHPLAMDGADPAMVAAIDASPVWAMSAWAIGVWGALLGSILLLLRRRLAVTAFGVSLVGLIAVGAYEFATDMPVNVPQTIAIWAIALVLLWYSWSQARKGVLR